jgi:uncharacterized ion transporter superfamily protein YfcC
MAKRITEEQKLMRQWWVLLILAAVFLGLAYGFASVAIDSGSLWQYGLAVIFLTWAIKYIAKGIRLALSR